jgi:hypothetical protein
MDLPGYDDWKTHNPADDCCEYCGADPRYCRGGWQPEECNGECGRSFRDPDQCEICGGLTTFVHDHRPDNTGLDDGPPLHAVRKKPEPKSGDEYRDIRARAWATRREKYGQYGHR